MSTKSQSIQKKLRFGNTSKAHLKKLDNKTVRYFDTPLKRKDKVKYLGKIFDEKIQWKHRIRNTTQKVNLKLQAWTKIMALTTNFTGK